MQNLDEELMKRLWHLFDVSKTFTESTNQTVEQWAELFKAIANVPESQHPSTKKQRRVTNNPEQPQVMVDGVLRYKENKIVRYLLDNGGIDMNKLASLSLSFSLDDLCQFAQLIGYSVDGYETLSYVQERSMINNKKRR